MMANRSESKHAEMFIFSIQYVRLETRSSYDVNYKINNMMICQETLIGYTGPINLVSILTSKYSTGEVILFGDKNPNKPPKKKQKKKKKAVEEPPVKRKRKKRKEKAA